MYPCLSLRVQSGSISMVYRLMKSSHVFATEPVVVYMELPSSSSKSLRASASEISSIYIYIDHFL